MYAKFKNIGNQGEEKKEENSPLLQGGDNPSSQNVETIKSLEHKKHIINSNKLVVVDIYGNWCGPCVDFFPKFQGLANKYNRNGLCALVKENVDDGFSQDVHGVPYFQFFFKGEKVDSVTGGNVKLIEEKIVSLLHDGASGQRREEYTPPSMTQMNSSAIRR